VEFYKKFFVIGMKNKGKNLDSFDIQQIEELIKALRNAAVDADTVAKKYSDDTVSKMAFEIGYLNGYCKTVADVLEQIMK
jgi:hypothetical protein